MADRLVITSWDIEHWGRASGSRQPAIRDGLTVVYGPNASGKSSVTTALAWLLAGPGTLDVLHPFGHFEDPLHASLTAQLGDDKVHLDIRMTVPKSTDEKLKNEGTGFTGDIGGVGIDRDDFRRRLGGVSFVLYRRYYWVDSLKISTTRDSGGGTDHSLTTQSVFGDLDPFAISEKLDEDGQVHIGKSKTKENTARWFVNKMSVQKELIRTAKQSLNNWARVDAKIEKISEDMETKRAALGASNGFVATLERAIAARPVHTSWLAASRNLDALPIPSEADRNLADNRVEVERAIGELETASHNISRTTAELNKHRREAGTWADLIGTIEASAGSIAEVDNAEQKVRRRRQACDDANAKRRSAVQPADVLNPREPTDPPIRIGYWTSLCLAIATAISVATERATPTIELGLGAIVVFVVTSVVFVVTSRRQSVAHRPVVDFDTDPKYLKSRLRDDIKARNDLLSAAGVPDTYISDDTDTHATDLQTVVKGQETKEDLDTAVRTQGDYKTRLHGHFPSEGESGQYSTSLRGAVERVDAFKTASDKNEKLLLKLQQAVGGVDTEEQQLLEDHSDSELHAKIGPASENCSTHEESIRDMETDRTGLMLEREKIAESSDIQGPTLELNRLKTEAQKLAMSGLAYLLAARLVDDAAHTYLDDNGPKLLSRALELSSAVATSWTNIRLNPDGDGLLVTDENGEHANVSSSTGDLTTLNLALRLATIELVAETTRTLPIILDDALLHLDKERGRAAISMLKEMAIDHQILYFTCQEDVANLAATTTGVALVNL